MTDFALDNFCQAAYLDGNISKLLLIGEAIVLCFKTCTLQPASFYSGLTARVWVIFLPSAYSFSSHSEFWKDFPCLKDHFA